MAIKSSLMSLGKLGFWTSSHKDRQCRCAKPNRAWYPRPGPSKQVQQVLLDVLSLLWTPDRPVPNTVAFELLTSSSRRLTIICRTVTGVYYGVIRRHKKRNRDLLTSTCSAMIKSLTSLNKLKHGALKAVDTFVCEENSLAFFHLRSPKTSCEEPFLRA